MTINLNYWDEDERLFTKAINWHITSKCNYRCKFCHYKNMGNFHLPFVNGKKIIFKLKSVGMGEINFAGGDPLLHPRLLDYCTYAKELGMTVSISTNGSLLNSKLINDMVGIVDWICLSVDSCNDYIEEMLGRGYGDHITRCIEIADKIHEADIRLKVNTTVTRLTYKENMRPIIRTLNPKRWGVFQMRHIQFENDEAAPDLSISDEQFAHFVELHKIFRLENCNAPVFESSEKMGRSYFMITPAGNVKKYTGGVISEYNLDELLREGIYNIVNI
jgi:radical S-adenosyl methionine domain-containing protein 2